MPGAPQPPSNPNLGPYQKRTKNVPRDVAALSDSPCGRAGDVTTPITGCSQSQTSGGTTTLPTPILVGGIYGLSLGSAFFAESMFTDLDTAGPAASGASSACLIALWHHLRACGYTLLDVQIANDHTIRFGVSEIPLDDYLLRLNTAVERPSLWRAL